MLLKGGWYYYNGTLQVVEGELVHLPPTVSKLLKGRWYNYLQQSTLLKECWYTYL